jgi:hypothetical protein
MERAYERMKMKKMVTGVFPSVDIEYKAPLWDWKVKYTSNWRYDAKRARASSPIPLTYF